MHNLAMALQQSGHAVSGSDDEIYEPSRSRLAGAGLLPDEMGWNPDRISRDLEVIVLGMHARPDNPELARAKELGIEIVSFPEFVARHSIDKTRVVIAGSHGKTTTTSMVMHVLSALKMQFDYLVGAIVPGFDLMVKLSDAPVIVIEGDEYLSSPVDRRPKFLHYEPHISVITGVAWDHMNVFPTLEEYHKQFALFRDSLPEDAHVFHYGGDSVLTELFAGSLVQNSAYESYNYKLDGEEICAIGPGGAMYPMRFFGQHNFENMQAAQLVCENLGVPEEKFLEAMTSFAGAAMRMQTLYEDEGVIVLRDFAHAPSKVRATVRATRERYLERPITAVVELHTFSSLSREFLPGYKDVLAPVDNPIVFYNPHTLEMKKLPALEPDYVKECFGANVRVVTTAENMLRAVGEEVNGVHLWMSSGRFGGVDLKELYT